MSIFFLTGTDWKTVFRTYPRSLFSAGCFGIFMVYALSVFNTEHLAAYSSVLKNKISFLLIPLSLLSIQSLEKKQVKIILYFFLASSVVSTCWSYLHYLPDKELYAKLYEQGQVIPTLIHHVSLAVLLSVSVLISLHLLLQTSRIPEKILLFLLLIWLIYFIHLLSVRTGIVLLYAGVALYGLSTLLYQKKYTLMLALVSGILMTGAIAFYTIPTLKSKINYTTYGITGYLQQSDTANQLSDSRRLLSDKIGLELILNHKLNGVGIGDLQDEMNRIYSSRYPDFKKEVYAHIHNQYLYTAAGTGLLLGSLFIVSLGMIWLYFIRKKDLLFSTLYFMLLLVMFWEPFIENQLGTSIFLLICCLGFVRNENA